MAIITEIEPQTRKPAVRREDRTIRVEKTTPRNGDYRLTLARERRELDEDGNVVAEDFPVINAPASAFAGMVFTRDDGSTFTAAEYERDSRVVYDTIAAEFYAGTGPFAPPPEPKPAVKDGE